jgi:hypothetical protein
VSIREAFAPLLKLTEKVIQLDILDLFEQVARTDEFKDLVIFLNQEGQLEQGKNANNELLSDVRKDKPGLGYSNSYALLRQRRGLKTDVITLDFTGKFRRSFEVNIDRNNSEVLIAINANTIKEDKDLLKVWGDEILGLSEESIQVLIEFTREAIQNNLRKLLFNS